MAILPPDPIYMLRGDMGPVHGLLFRVSPYVEHLYASTESGKVHIWDLRRNRQLTKMVVGEDPCQAVRLLGDDHLATQQKCGAISIWNASGSNWLLDKTIQTEYCGFCKCQVLSEDLILVPLKDSGVGILSLKTYKVECRLDPSRLAEAKSLGEVMSIVTFQVQGSKLVLVAYESGDLALWDIEANNVISWLKIETCIMTVEFDVSLMRGVLGSPSDKLEIFELSRARVLSHKSTVSQKNPGTSVVTGRPDARVFAAGGWDGRLRIFSWKSLRPFVVLDLHKGAIHDIVYSTCKVEAYDSKCVMAAAGKDGNVSLWDLYN